MTGVDDGEDEEVGTLLRDNLVPYLSLADVMVIPATGHLIPLEAPADLAGAVGPYADRSAGHG